MALTQKAEKASSSPCPQGLTPPDSPTMGSATPHTADAGKEGTAEPGSANRDPPNTPDVPLENLQQAPDMDELRQLLLKSAHVSRCSSVEPMDKRVDSTDSGPATNQWPENTQSDEPEALMLEFKHAMEPYETLKQYRMHIANCVSPGSPYISPSEDMASATTKEFIIASPGDIVSFAKWAMEGASFDICNVDQNKSGNAKTCSHIASTEHVTLGQLKDLLEAVLGKKSESPAGPVVGPTGAEEVGEQDKDNKRIRASKMDYKTVNEVWDEKSYNYKIVDSAPDSDVDELDEWIFVIRKRVDRKSGELVIFVDVKSPALRNILRNVLKNIRTASLEADKPAVERNLLYHFLPELKDYPCPDTEKRDHSDEGISHLELLVQHLEGAYHSITKQLSSLLAHRKITYDLLWALFKPGTLAFVKCPSTGLPRCIQYSFGAESQTDREVDCFKIQGHFFDFDGEIFGETTETVQVEVFRGAIRIESLPIYPLVYHPDPATRSRLISNGRKFISLMACHHRQYEGNMFVLNDRKLVKLHVDSRIMIDARLFRKTIPNYPRFEIKKPQMFDMFAKDVLQTTSVDRIRGKGINPSEMDNNDLARCSPTLLGFSFNRKIWGEFAIENIHEINFSSSPFDMLAIPEANKKVVRSLTESRIRATHDARNDDVIIGKGQGVNILLHGPPGVGKTLTAEAIAEFFQRPLYSISSGQLSSDAQKLEVQLCQIFDAAAAWKAVLLLDEADVYLQRRDALQLERNRIVATFLRTLEYYGGIFFLTTNMLNGFDEAILDRIQLKLRYGNLDLSARRNIFDHHFKEANAEIEEKDLSMFAEIKLNGRQIKNIVKIAFNVASSDGAKLSASHVRMALTANQYTLPFQESLGFDDSLYEA